MIVLGKLAGALRAAATLATTLDEAPMVVDKAIEADSAIAVSLRATRANAGVIARWGLIVAALLVIGAIPIFIGLAVVLPVLWYATWHLYTRLVERRSEEHTSELQSLMRISYAVFCLKKKKR